MRRNPSGVSYDERMRRIVADLRADDTRVRPLTYDEQVELVTKIRHGIVRFE